MNWTSIGAGQDTGEAGLVAERLDALQARVELLERDRDSRLRDAAADIRERKARLRELEDERNAALRSSIESKTRLESAQRELDELRQQRRRLERSLQEARATGVEATTLRQSLERSEAQVVALLEERATIAEFVNRTAESTAWRVGHRFTSIGRLLTFRRSHGTSALARLQTRLERAPLELPSPDGRSGGEGPKQLAK